VTRSYLYQHTQGRAPISSEFYYISPPLPPLTSRHPNFTNMLAIQQSQSLPRRQYHLQHQPLSYNNTNNEHASRSSTQNWVAAYSTPLTPTHSDFDFSNDSNYVPSSDHSAIYSLSDPEQSQNLSNHHIRVQTPFGSSRDSALMQSEHSVAPSSWHFTNGQLTPTSARTHYRESSLSSLGSAGPASPYTASTSHPQVILPSDSVAEQYYDAPVVDHNAYQSYSKPLTPHTPSHDYNFLGSLNHGGYSAHTYNSEPNYHMMAMQKNQQSGDDDSMPAPEYGHSGRPSVASTHESPATPNTGDDYDEQNRKNGEPASMFPGYFRDEYLSLHDLADYRSTTSVPRLERTMTDVYNDELYNPNLVFTSAPSTKPISTTMLPQPQSDIFSQRLQAANSQHLSASTQSPLIDQSRGRSPFRQGSPLAPTSNSFGSPQALGSAAKLREMRKVENDARILQQQIQRRSPGQTTPKTISPKDALLDYHESEEDSTMPLFPPSKVPQFQLQQNHQLIQEQSQPDFEDASSQQSFGSMATSRRESSAYSTSSQATQQGSGFTFAPPSVPGGLNIPQQYPFVPQRRQTSNMSTLNDRTPEFPSTLTSMESSSSEYAPEDADIKKPAGTSADGGTYTCTYHGCTLRFETPIKLQKHKREGHRQSAPLIGGVGASDSSSGMTSAALLRNSQAGPHKCDRINPSTGKPCNTIFSRPYDLTRHEDTIHNGRKQKVRCHLCTEEKTFSRNDALTRHMRVVHPEVDFPGKTRRRTIHSPIR
jgi:26S proteasome regulatory subunit N4